MHKLDTMQIGTNPAWVTEGKRAERFLMPCPAARERNSMDRRRVAPRSTDQTTAAAPRESPESRLIRRATQAGETQYDRYLARPNSKRSDSISILRGWSSAIPLLDGSERRWRGGGYFLTWRGFGIVLDPGFDFLRNFHDAGFHAREISAVIVSHNHPDHNTVLSQRF